jgi:hypothetical protein
LELYREAGKKCANPGCPNTLLELHHIREWCVYRTHDRAHMIAVCPTCHGHAHHGKLRIDDATIRSWKAIGRTATKQAHLYVEPGPSCKVLLGSLLMTNGPANATGIIVFQLSPSNQLSFRVADGDIMLVNLRVTDTSGREVVRVVDGYLKHHAEEPVWFESRPGRCRLTAPALPAYIPPYIVEKYNASRPHETLVVDGRFTVLDVEVLDRGLVQVQGVWFEGTRAVVVTHDWLSLWLPPTDGFTHLRGYGDRRGEPKNLNKLPVFRHDGSIDFSILAAALRLGGI